MEEAIAGSPGWSESGGPWVPGSQGMKKYVWSETFVEVASPSPARSFILRRIWDSPVDEHLSIARANVRLCGVGSLS
jgi:hypothetical protein